MVGTVEGRGVATQAGDNGVGDTADGAATCVLAVGYLYLEIEDASEPSPRGRGGGRRRRARGAGAAGPKSNTETLCNHPTALRRRAVTLLSLLTTASAMGKRPWGNSGGCSPQHVLREEKSQIMM